jgi:hypothetical protein
MNEYLSMLEHAISDMGCWRWWTAEVAGSFQVEFVGTQIGMTLGGLLDGQRTQR